MLEILKKPYKYPLKKGKKFKKIVIRLSIGLAAFLLLSFSILALTPGTAANFADYVLRPAIGSSKTVLIESFFFSMSDWAKQIFTIFGAKQSTDIFNATATTTQPVAKKTVPLKPLQYVLNESPIKYHPGIYATLPGEGIWTPVQLPQFGTNDVMAKTFVLPDAHRPYAITSLIKINMHYANLKAVAGTSQPGGPIGNPGKGFIPQADQSEGKLFAAFNGGFQYKDGQFGMTIGSKVYVPLQAGLATVIMYKDGTAKLETYNGNQQDLKNSIAVRQNGPAIVEDSKVLADTSSGGMSRWGLTVTNSMYTWRSGLGITKNGNLIYAVGPSLNVNTLAAALQAAGSVTAMQLDINPFWVRFVLYQPDGSGGYTYESLVKAMQNGGSHYLNGYTKDFFYLTTK